jgi:ribosomal protein S27E
VPRRTAKGFGKVPGARSTRPVYREAAINHCPGCGRSQWLVGRFSSECAFCGTALPLQEGGAREAYNGKPVFVTRKTPR